MNAKRDVLRPEIPSSVPDIFRELPDDVYKRHDYVRLAAKARVGGIGGDDLSQDEIDGVFNLALVNVPEGREDIKEKLTEFRRVVSSSVSIQMRYSGVAFPPTLGQTTPDVMAV